MSAYTEELLNKIASIAVFVDVKHCEILRCLKEYLILAGWEGKTASVVEKYTAFLSLLYQEGADFGQYLANMVAKDDNVYIRAASMKKSLPTCISDAAYADLEVFSELSCLQPSDIAALCDSRLLFENTAFDFVREYKKRLSKVEVHGYGIFADCGMFRIANGEIIPVESADRISTEDFVGYHEERQQVYENTKALVEGRPAANVLLCGDAGTGKSSTVKASANAYFEQGVRLIEMRKDQLSCLPEILGILRENPLKFIIFIDDLSFNKNDDNFSMLKAALEGSASAKTQNVVIYATSNRRHIVKETFSDREGDDIHRNDTMQELWSLSERFGLTVLFQKPDKALYLEIVQQLARQKGIAYKGEELNSLAETYALKRGGRSARAAEQFTDSLL